MTTGAEGLPRPTRKQRVAAGVAFGAHAAASVYLAVAAAAAWDVVMVSIAALATLVVAAWFALSRRGRVRVLAVAVAAVALVVFTVVLVVSEALLVLVVALLLAAACAAAARVALRSPAAPSAAGASAPRPRHPVLIMNMRSGGGKAEKSALDERCRERGIEPLVLTPGSDVLGLAKDAISRGAHVLGMAGGDGSQALVASVASRHGVPLVVAPARTRNHLALDLGLDREDVVGALDAFQDGLDRVIDLAEVNGRVFVNTRPWGSTPRSSSRRSTETPRSTPPQPCCRTCSAPAHRLDLRFTLPPGEEAATANLVLVSNNSYQLGYLLGAGTRQRLDGGALGIVSVLVRGAGDAEKLAALQAAGQVGRFSGWNEWTATEFELRSGAPVDVGIDGEGLTMDPPLRFVTRPGALTVRVPRSASARAPGADVVHVGSASTLSALGRTALGRPAATA